MSSSSLNSVIGQVMRVVRQGSPNVTDDRLLERFVTHRDEEAFETIVWRHGPMVWSTCHRILRHAQDVEDAFQATFLILSRKATTIRDTTSLGCWLHQVARRACLRARATRPATVAFPVVDLAHEDDASSQLYWRELKPVLDDELDRLPEKYRSPLILHYFEGKTLEQTAGELRWPVGTVNSRLARSRELLRKRLGRRGVMLSTAALSVSLTEHASAETVTGLLVSNTVKAVMSFAAGVTATVSAVSVKAIILADGVLRAMMMAKLKYAAALVIALGFIGSGTALVAVGAGNPLSPKSPETGNATASPQRQPEENKTGKKTDDGAELKTVQISASGRVVDSDGKPVTNASVYLVQMSLFRSSLRRQSDPVKDILAVKLSDADGRFSFKNVEAFPMQLGPSNTYHNRKPWNIVILAKDYAVGWDVLSTENDSSLKITLSPEVKLTGRFVDTDGKPAVGVRVPVYWIGMERNLGSRDYVEPFQDLWLANSQVPLAAVTDADGRFVLENLPKQARLSIWPSGERYAQRYVAAATVAKAELERMNAGRTGPDRPKYVSDGFTMTLNPARTLRGRVVYDDTGKPAAGARVNIGRRESFADQEGRFIFGQLDTEKLSPYVVAPHNAPYLWINSVELAIPPDKEELYHEFRLLPGCMVTGRLMDKKTGEPIRIPHVSINYREEGHERSFGHAYTKHDGSFRIVVPPGKVKLFIWDTVPGYLGRVDEKQTSQEIDVKPGQALANLNFSLGGGQTFKGKVLDPDGKPLAGAEFLAGDSHLPSDANGEFTLRGLNATTRQDILIFHAKRLLGLKLSLLPGASPPREIKLQPTLTITGQVLNEQNKPIPSATASIAANILTREDPGGRTSYVVKKALSPVTTDHGGKFSIAGVVPGVSYSINVSAGGYAAVTEHVKYHAGKSLAVPDIVLPAADYAISGRVVNSFGDPLESVQVTLQTRNQKLAPAGHRSISTSKTGHFHFGGLAKEEYCVQAALWRATGRQDDDGRPSKKCVAHADLQVESGAEDVRIILNVPRDPSVAIGLLDKAAPGFFVTKWLNRASAANGQSFNAADFRDKVVLLAFLDEAKPSRRILPQLNQLHAKLAAQNLVIVRVYDSEADGELAEASPTIAAVVRPSLTGSDDGEAFPKYGVKATPTLFLIDKTGVLKHADVELDKLEAVVAELLKK